MMHEPLIKERIEKAIQEGCASQEVWRERPRRGTAKILLTWLFALFNRRVRKNAGLHRTAKLVQK